MNNNDYLQHYGVLGQKWGVRNYQNADGSLTSKGRKHYGMLGRQGRTIGEYYKSADATRKRIADNVRLNTKSVLSGQSTVRDAVKNYASARTNTMKDWAKETSYKQDMKFGLGYFTVGALSTGIGKVLVDHGNSYTSEMIGSALLGYGVSSMISGPAAAAINAGQRWYYSNKK